MSRNDGRVGEGANGAAASGETEETMVVVDLGEQQHTVSREVYDQILKDDDRRKFLSEHLDDIGDRVAAEAKTQFSSVLGSLDGSAWQELVGILKSLKAVLPDDVKLLAIFKALVLVLSGAKVPDRFSFLQRRAHFKAVEAARTVVDEQQLKGVLLGLMNAKRLGELATEKTTAEAERDAATKQAEELQTEKAAVQEQLNQTLANMSVLNRTANQSLNTSVASVAGRQKQYYPSRDTDAQKLAKWLDWSAVRIAVLKIIFDYAVEEQMLTAIGEKGKEDAWNVLPEGVRPLYRQLIRGECKTADFIALAKPILEADARWKGVVLSLDQVDQEGLRHEQDAKQISEQTVKQVGSGAKEPLKFLYNAMDPAFSSQHGITASSKSRTLLLTSREERKYLNGLVQVARQQQKQGPRAGNAAALMPGRTVEALNGGVADAIQGPSHT